MQKGKRTRIFGIFLLLLTLLGTQAAWAAAPEDAEPIQDVVILYTNDVHCGVEDGVGYAGIAALEEYYAEQGCAVLLVDAGDAIQGDALGTLSKGESIIKIMNELDYDVATLGNHEFDYNTERLLELAEMAEFPYVCCNFVDLRTSKPAPVFEPYQILEAGGRKIAFVGVATPESLNLKFQNDKGQYIYSFMQDEDGSALYDCVQQAVDDAREAGADYVVALTHLGSLMALSPYTGPELINHTSGIDVVLDGHSHHMIPCDRVKNKNGEWVLLSQTGTKLASVGMLLIEKDGSVSTGLIETAEKDPETDAFVQSIMAEFEAQLQEVVARSDVQLTTMDAVQTDVRIIRRAETNLGDFCADAYRIVSGADIGLVNGGGIRADIQKGDITYEDILAVHPFGNAMCVAKATGQEILDSLELGVMNYPEENGGFLHVSGLTFEVDSSIPTPVKLDAEGMLASIEGERRVENVKVAGIPLAPEKTYTVASHEYLLKQGGSSNNLFIDNELVQEDFMLDNQLLIHYIVEVLGGVIGEEYADPYGQERIVIK